VPVYSFLGPQGSGSNPRFRSVKVIEPGPSEGSGPAICTNLNLNIGFGSGANLVRNVHEPDHGQSNQKQQNYPVIGSTIMRF
jgi:hypothetical protein